MTTLKDRAAKDETAAIEKVRRVVMLRADWETQDKLREWAKGEGFDLGWSYSGWPQHSGEFDFHITIVYSENAVRIEDGVRWIDPITVAPTGYEVLGESTPAIVIEPNERLSAIRDFFVSTFGVKPTYPDFKPHISLSYKWTGEPDVVQTAPALPDFPLVFDLLMVAQIKDEPKPAKDAAPVARKAMHAADKAAISGTRRTTDGYLVTDARVARGGNIQDYYGHEIGEGEPNQLFKIWRPEDEIFRADSLATFAHKPVTLEHPAIEVTPETWRRDAVGHVGSEVVRDGEFVRVPLVVMDAGAIEAIENGTREISMGYDCDLVMQAGTTADGRAYDGYQRNIRINHCAIVPAGRAGPQCRIGDSEKRSNQEGKTMAKSVTIDGKTFEVADDVATALAKGTITDTIAAAGKAVSDATAEIATLKKRAEDAEKAATDAKAEAEEAKKATLTADQIADMAAELADVIAAAKTVAPTLDAKGKTAVAIKREVVSGKLGDAAKDKSDDYIAAMFDAILANTKDADPIADAIKGGNGKVADAGKKAADAYDAYLANAWKGGAA